MVRHQSWVHRQNHQSVVGIGVMNALRHVVQAVWNDKGEVSTTAGRPLHTTHAEPGTLVKNGNGLFFLR
jgi:hypothetical protein